MYRRSRPHSVAAKGVGSMKQYILVAALIAAVFALPAAGQSAVAPPGPPHAEHFTQCMLLPFGQWEDVRMLMTPSMGGDTFWITAPEQLAGHYVIQSYRNLTTKDGPSLVPGALDPRWSSWGSLGKKTGLLARSNQLECRGYFDLGSEILWVDSIDVVVQ